MERASTTISSQLLLSGNELRVLGWLFLMFFVLYSYEITNFNITIDDEMFAYAPASAFVSLGRWVFPLIRAEFWPQVVVPLGPYLIFGLCIAWSYIYILRAFRITKPSLFHYAAFAALVLFPVWPAQLEFAANVIPLAVAVVSISASALLTTQSVADPLARNFASFLVSATLLAISAGAYQSAILIFPVLMMGVVMAAMLDRTSDAPPVLTRAFLLSGAVLLSGIGLYLLTAKLIMVTFGVEPSAYGRSFVNIGPILSSPQKVLVSMANDLWGVYFDWWKPFGIAGYPILGCLLLGAGICIHVAWGSWQRVALVILGICFIGMLPAAFSLLSGSGLPLRTMLAAPFSLLVFMLLSHQLAHSANVRAIALSVVVLTGLQELYIQSIYQARATVVQRQDLLFASAVNTDILRTLNVPGTGPVRVDFCGARKLKTVYPALRTTTAGASFFEWDNGNPDRMVRYMNVIGFDRYVAVEKRDRAQHAPICATMPAWPRSGSVRVVQGVVLVKLSDE